MEVIIYFKQLQNNIHWKYFLLRIFDCIFCFVYMGKAFSKSFSLPDCLISVISRVILLKDSPTGINNASWWQPMSLRQKQASLLEVNSPRTLKRLKTNKNHYFEILFKKSHNEQHGKGSLYYGENQLKSFGKNAHIQTDIHFDLQRYRKWSKFLILLFWSLTYQYKPAVSIG